MNRFLDLTTPNMNSFANWGLPRNNFSANFSDKLFDMNYDFSKIMGNSKNSYDFSGLDWNSMNFPSSTMPYIPKIPYMPNMPWSYNPAKSGLSNFWGGLKNTANVIWDKVKGSSFGKSIAKAAQWVANAMNTKGWCYTGVKRALSKHGVNLSGGSAYQAAPQLAKNPKFKEVSVPANKLKDLPAGAIVVWNRSASHVHGHISIASGDGREFSDRTRNQISNYGTDYRVFIPVDKAK
ncbi:MAG: hypothetical protein A2287_01710 [Candidatus Melainabacteria bacterium RIFOXYA12_FULL_32_12]|nr:MAG: hypothetical protein A2255_01610 [Candidatus Melainabacteria bacterium RIFOXYA2_FULL_32_9]OGI28073.1 MAG: hypothetical protein A2287_01710 [Candidatus Melainabacteria bacterium RIFOXYA12_FULL_32_12]